MLAASRRRVDRRSPHCGGDDGATLTALRPTLAGSCIDLRAPASFTAATRRRRRRALHVAGTPVAAHCLVTGAMYERTSAVDGKRYAIGFEMRLPHAWNGRFFYQANGGIDGSVVAATGGIGGGGPADAARCTWASPSSAPTPATAARRTAALRHRPAGAARLRLPGRRAS